MDRAKNGSFCFCFQAILSEDGKLVLGDLRSKGGEEWSITGKSVTNLTKDERKVLDLALLPGQFSNLPKFVIKAQEHAYKGTIK